MARKVEFGFIAEHRRPLCLSQWTSFLLQGIVLLRGIYLSIMLEGRESHRSAEGPSLLAIMDYHAESAFSSTPRRERNVTGIQEYNGTRRAQARDHNSTLPRLPHRQARIDAVNTEEFPQTQHARAVRHEIVPIISSSAENWKGPISTDEVSHTEHGQCSVSPTAGSVPVSQPSPRPKCTSQQPMAFPQRSKVPVVAAMDVAPSPNPRDTTSREVSYEVPSHNASKTSPAGRRRTRRKQYMPFALRWPFLIALLLSLFALAGLLAVSLRVLPISHTDSLGQMAKRGSTNEHHGRPRRQTSLLPTFARVDIQRLAPPVANYSETSTSTTSNSATESVGPISKNHGPGHKIPQPTPPVWIPRQLGRQVMRDHRERHVQETKGGAKPASTTVTKIVEKPSSVRLAEQFFLNLGIHTIIFRKESLPSADESAPMPGTSSTPPPVTPDPMVERPAVTSTTRPSDAYRYRMSLQPMRPADPVEIAQNELLELGKKTVNVHPRSVPLDEVTQTTKITSAPNELSSSLDDADSMLTYIPILEEPHRSDQRGQQAATPTLRWASSDPLVLDPLTGLPGPQHHTITVHDGWNTGSRAFDGEDDDYGGPVGFLRIDHATIQHAKKVVRKREEAWNMPTSSQPAFEQTTTTTMNGQGKAFITAPPQASASLEFSALADDPWLGQAKSKTETDNGDSCDNGGCAGLPPIAFIPIPDGPITITHLKVMVKKTDAALALPTGNPTVSAKTPYTIIEVAAMGSRPGDHCDGCFDYVHVNGFPTLGEHKIVVHKLVDRAETAALPPRLTTEEASSATPATTMSSSSDSPLGSPLPTLNDLHAPDKELGSDRFVLLRVSMVQHEAGDSKQQAEPFVPHSRRPRPQTTPAVADMPSPPPLVVRSSLPSDLIIAENCDDAGECDIPDSDDPILVPGVGPGGFITIGKHTMFYVRNMAKKTGSAIINKPVVTVIEEATIEVIPAMAPTTVTETHYTTIHPSVTTHTGRHSISISNHRSTKHPATTVRPPLSTTRPEPETTTVEYTVEVIDLKMGHYFVCFFLPTLLCTLLAIPVRLVDQSVRLLQPFHELANRSGAIGQDSLWLETAGWRCRVASLRHLFGSKQSLVFLTGVLQVLTWLLVSFSATAVGLRLVGDCRQGDPYSTAHNCGMTPAVFLRPTIIMLSLLGSMAVVLTTIMARLTHWDTGVYEDPWSISAQARLSRSPELRARMRLATPGTSSDREAKSAKFLLGHFDDEDKGAKSYGVVPLGPNPSAPLTRSVTAPVSTFLTSSSTWLNEKSRKMMRKKKITDGGEKLEVPFTLGYTGRALFLVFMCGLMAVILYYRNVDTPSAFEDFMDDESYGVTLLFTGVGTIATEFWSSFAEGKSIGPLHP